MNNSIFSPDEVTIVRKKGDNYITETITTSPILGGETNAEKLRRNVIARLRKDPSVILVLEGKDGVCEETAKLPDGFSIVVGLYEDNKKESGLAIYHNGKEVYSAAFTLNEEYDEFENIEGLSLSESIETLLYYIDCKDYSLFDDEELNSENAEEEEEEEEYSFYDTKVALSKTGMETEVIYCPGGVYNEPALFVHENKVLLLGSKRFEGNLLYVDMKRVPFNFEQEFNQEILRKFRNENKGIDVIEWEDGSWSFRSHIEYAYNEEGFLESLNESISELEKAADWLKAQEGLHCDFDGERAKRYLFIYEVLGEALKVNNLKM